MQMMAVLAFPPKEDCSIRVNLESLKGMCPFFPLLYSYIEQENYTLVTNISNFLQFQGISRGKLLGKKKIFLSITHPTS